MNGDVSSHVIPPRPWIDITISSALYVVTEISLLFLFEAENTCESTPLLPIQLLYTRILYSSFRLANTGSNLCKKPPRIQVHTYYPSLPAFLLPFFVETLFFNFYF